MIKEFAPSDFAAGINEALEASAVVVRGLIDPEQAAAISALAPEIGKQRIYLSPSLLRKPELVIPTIQESQYEVNAQLMRRLGGLSTMFGHYVMRPDMLRTGQTKPHLDGRGTIISGSLNLDGGEYGLTTFFAHRLGEVNAPYSTLEAEWEQNELAVDTMAGCTLNPGDMVIVSRGVVHGSNASGDRTSITYRTRGIVRGDFK